MTTRYQLSDTQDPTHNAGAGSPTRFSATEREFEKRRYSDEYYDTPGYAYDPANVGNNRGAMASSTSTNGYPDNDLNEHNFNGQTADDPAAPLVRNVTQRRKTQFNDLGA